MGRKKRQRIQAASKLPNVFDYLSASRQTWADFFKNQRLIILELGCGRGDYTIFLAKLWPQFNFVGLDKKGARLFSAGQAALKANLANVAFLRAEIKEVARFFLPQSVAQIWLTFPDPFPRPKQAKKRLTHPRFLTEYKKIICPRGQLHLKTDDEQLFAYSLKAAAAANWRLIKKAADLYRSPLLARPELQIQTTYEKKHLAQGKKIFYAAWLA